MSQRDQAEPITDGVTYLSVGVAIFVGGLVLDVATFVFALWSARYLAWFDLVGW